MVRNVLISGAGVAGLAAAYWLSREGFRVTLVEREPALRRGGQAVDIRGKALDVVAAMGLLGQARSLRTRLKGMQVIDPEGRELSRTTERTFSAGRLDSDDIEIFRDDLCAMLAAVLGVDVEQIYDESIAAIHDDGIAPEVTFASGAVRRFDLVIGADGIYSKTRRLVFADEAAVVRPLDVVLALFSTPNLLGQADWEIAHRSETAGFVIYPSRDKTELRVGVGFGTDGKQIARDDTAAQREEVASRCASFGGDMPRLIRAMREASEFYYNELAQIRMPAWSKGCVVLAGDAAHCASPFSGQGTSLALVGAFVLARELGRNREDADEAFAAYEARMRPYVLMNQDMVDLTRQGPTPDEIMTRAKNGIDLDDLLPPP